MSDEGIVDPEHRWPITYLMRWLTILLATATACLGSQASSIMTASNLWPPAPPAPLICSMAVSTPALTISPYWATEPLMGPAMAIWTVCACADRPRTARMDAAAIEWMRMDEFMVRVWIPSGRGQSPASCREEVGGDPVAGLAGGSPWFSRSRPPARCHRLTSASFRPRSDGWAVSKSMRRFGSGPSRSDGFTSRCLLPASLQRLAISFPSVLVDMWLPVLDAACSSLLWQPRR